MARTMMLAANVAKNLWAEAISTAAYIINRCMIRPMLEKTPYELLKGRKPNISHFRTFGCKCFIHNNGKDNLGKFDAKSDEGIFLGYSLHSKVYRVLNNKTNYVEESMHVIFDESYVKTNLQEGNDSKEQVTQPDSLTEASNLEAPQQGELKLKAQ